jgi:hypothetical protein
MNETLYDLQGTAGQRGRKEKETFNSLYYTRVSTLHSHNPAI